MAVSVFTVSLTSGQLAPTSGVDLGTQGWKQMTLIIPSIACGMIGMAVSETEAGTYRPMIDIMGATTSPVAQIMQVASALVVDGAAAVFPGGARFVKVTSSSGVTNTTSNFKIICSD